MASEVKQKCFVIMPFSKTSEKHTKEYWTKHYETFIKPLIESGHSLIAERSSPLRGDILRQIVTDLVTAPIVVADLTDANPNVYWELGVRQSFKHGTITIAEEGTHCCCYWGWCKRCPSTKGSRHRGSYGDYRHRGM